MVTQRGFCDTWSEEKTKMGNFLHYRAKIEKTIFPTENSDSLSLGGFVWKESEKVTMQADAVMAKFDEDRNGKLDYQVAQKNCF